MPTSTIKRCASCNISKTLLACNPKNLPLPSQEVVVGERGRSRGHQRRSVKPQSKIILSTPSAEVGRHGGSSSSTLSSANGEISQCWIPRRRRSPSTRQRREASLIRESSLFSSPTDHLFKAEGSSYFPPKLPPSNPDYEAILELSNSEFFRLPWEVDNAKLHAGRKVRRRSQSEFRTALRPIDNCAKLRIPRSNHQHQEQQRELWDINDNGHYSKVTSEKQCCTTPPNKNLSEPTKSRKNRLSQSKKAGLMTVWPGKTGVWLPT